VARVAAQLEQHGDATVTVVGHTDRIGSDAANMALSQRRAQSVRDALVSNGVAASSIRAVGAGESQPVVQCGEGSRNEVVACLAPNRRVEIAVQKRG
jgi:outer membrane protein OmpA-like peptidoglycan-associated protein